MNKRRILLVDDEKDFTSLLKLNLEATGDYDVETENDPTQALLTAVRFNPDVILLDVIMPNMEGPDVLNTMKHHDMLHNTPVIFLTATVKRSEVSTYGGSIGGHVFVAKPSPLEELLETIQNNVY